MIHLEIKPLSVNECWQGKRFKTKAYLKYYRGFSFKEIDKTLKNGKK